MNRTLILKELHDLRIILAFAGIGALFLLPSLFGLPLTAKFIDYIGNFTWFIRNESQNTINYPPFSPNGYIWYVGFGAFSLALALGFTQGLNDNRGGRWQFLLSLPITRNEVIFAKILSGVGILLLFSLIMVWTGIAYCALPGRIPYPLEWWIILDASKWLPLSMVLYFSSLFCGLRRARWLGTRLLPLIGSLVLFWAIGSIFIKIHLYISTFLYESIYTPPLFLGFIGMSVLSTLISLLISIQIFRYSSRFDIR